MATTLQFPWQQFTGALHVQDSMSNKCRHSLLNITQSYGLISFVALLRFQAPRSSFPLVRFLYLLFHLPFMVCLLFTTLRGVGCIIISHLCHSSVTYSYLFTIWLCYLAMICCSCICNAASRHLAPSGVVLLNGDWGELSILSYYNFPCTYISHFVVILALGKSILSGIVLLNGDWVILALALIC